MIKYVREKLTRFQLSFIKKCMKISQRNLVQFYIFTCHSSKKVEFCNHNRQKPYRNLYKNKE